MLIRHARETDAKALARFICMAESEMVHHFTGTSDPEKSAEALLQFVLSPVPCRYSVANNTVAEIDGQTAGAMISFPADSQPDLDGLLLDALNRRGHNLNELFFEGVPGSYYLSTMGVDPQFRGQGVGTALMRAAEEKGKRQNFTQLSLLVSKAKDRAKKLYERMGFRVTEEVAIGEVQYYRMVKDLG